MTEIAHLPDPLDWLSPVDETNRRRLYLGLTAAGAMAAAALAGAYHHFAASPAETRAGSGAAMLDGRRFAKPPTADVDAQSIIAQTASDADLLNPLSPNEAKAMNSRIPVVTDSGPAAMPALIPLGQDGSSYLRALDCLTAAVYYEAANESADGQRAVAQVVLNRMRHVAYPHTVCGVVFQGSGRQTGCQFSFTCDGSLARLPTEQGWRRARQVAMAALAGSVYQAVGLATHYHADYVYPYWAPTLVKQKVIGAHIFYRWPGAWGRPRSFLARYDMTEPEVWPEGEIRAALSDGKENGMDNAGQDDRLASLSARPVIMSGRAIAMGGSPAPASSLPAEGAAPPRMNLLSKAAPSPRIAQGAAQEKPLSGGITGGIIMAGASSGAKTAEPARPSPEKVE